MADLEEDKNQQEPEAEKSNLDDTVIEVEVEKPTYQTKPYSSLEQKFVQKIFLDSGVKDFAGKFLEWGAKTCYGVIASIYRIPTLIRKGYNEQLLPDRLLKEKDQPLSKRSGVITGFLVGGALGTLTDFVLGAYTIVATSEKDYLPLAIWGATNLVSGAFEIGRWSKSKQERLEVLAQRAQKEQEKKARLERKGTGGGGN